MGGKFEVLPVLPFCELLELLLQLKAGLVWS